MMRKSLIPMLIVAFLSVTAAGWSLDSADRKGIDKLLSDTVSSLTSGDPPLWKLFSTQGSAAVMKSGDALTLAGRSDLKTNADTASMFSLPENTQIADTSLRRAGEFIIGRATLQSCMTVTAEVPKQRPDAVVKAFFPDRLSGTMLDKEQKLQRIQKQQKSESLMTIGALQDAPEGSWRYVSVCITPPAEETEEEQIDAVLTAFSSLERTVRSGDISDLSASLYEDPFVAAVYTPDGQGWFFVYPEYMTTMLSSAIGMGATGESRISSPDVVAMDNVATAVTQWYLDIPALGAMDLGIVCTLVKDNETWKIVSLCGGLLEEW